MGRDENDSTDAPPAAPDGAAGRVYVPPRAIPPKAKVQTIELDTIKVRDLDDERHAPTIRVRRPPEPSSPAEVASTLRPGTVWGGRAKGPAREAAEAPRRPASVDEPGDAETRPSPPVVVAPPIADDDPSAVETRPTPSSFDPREAVTLPPGSRIPVGRIHPGQSDVLPALTDGLGLTSTPRPDSRISSQELEAIQSARTLEVRQTPHPPIVAAPEPRRRPPLGLIALGMVIGVLIVWVAYSIGRSHLTPRAAARDSTVYGPSAPPGASTELPAVATVSPVVSTSAAAAPVRPSVARQRESRLLPLPPPSAEAPAPSASGRRAIY